MRFDVPFLSVLGFAALSNGVAAASVQLRSQTAGSVDKLAEAEFAIIPIDHNDSSVGTYQNRYWVNDKHYAPGGPIFVYDTGEGNATAKLRSSFCNSSSWFEGMAKEFHGMGILWEHRYYGESLPFPVKSDPAPEHMKYLTTKQALADIPYFAKDFHRDNFHDTDLTPKGSPWVMIGASYPGVRAALTREKYPDTIYAAFAASAPVQARINMTSYHEQVYRGMEANKLGGCVKHIQAAMRFIDDQLCNDETAASIKQKFFGPGAETNSNGDFASLFPNIYRGFQKYGTNRGRHGQRVVDLCEHMETGPEELASSGELDATHGSQVAAERLATWSSFKEYRCRGTEPCELFKPNKFRDTISWTWQFCTEWGFFQANNFGPHALLSKYNTLEEKQGYCNRNFPTAVQSGALPSKPQANALNEEFGGWNMRPSNVYWSGGEFDPWLSLTPLSTEDFAPDGVHYSTEIPKAGVQTDEHTLFGYVMKGKVHGHDFGPDDDEAAETSRNIFKKALREWLPCYKSQGDA